MLLRVAPVILKIQYVARQEAKDISPPIIKNSKPNKKLYLMLCDKNRKAKKPMSPKLPATISKRSRVIIKIPTKIPTKTRDIICSGDKKA